MIIIILFFILYVFKSYFDIQFRLIVINKYNYKDSIYFYFHDLFIDVYKNTFQKKNQCIPTRSIHIFKR